MFSVKKNRLQKKKSIKFKNDTNNSPKNFLNKMLYRKCYELEKKI